MPMLVHPGLPKVLVFTSIYWRLSSSVLPGHQHCSNMTEVPLRTDHSSKISIEQTSAVYDGKG